MDDHFLTEYAFARVNALRKRIESELGCSLPEVGRDEIARRLK